MKWLYKNNITNIWYQLNRYVCIFFLCAIPLSPPLQVIPKCIYHKLWLKVDFHNCPTTFADQQGGNKPLHADVERSRHIHVFVKFSKNSEIIHFMSIFGISMKKCIKMSTNKPMFAPVVLEIAYDIFINKTVETCSLARM